MQQKNVENEPGDVTRASVRTEMARPPMARSARIAALHLDPTRMPEPPRATVAGTVDTIIRSRRFNQPEQAQIAIDGAEPRHRDLRTDNPFTDELGDDVALKRGARVEVTVTAESTTSTATINGDR